MKKDTVWLVISVALLVCVVGGLIWMFSGGEELEESISEKGDSVVEEEEDLEPEEKVVFDDVVDEDITFSSEPQTIGSTSDTQYSLDDISVKKGAEYVEIVFTLNSEEEGEFEVEVFNNSRLGVLEMRVKGVDKYNASLSYGSKMGVDHEGISSFSKVIESVELEERFYLGCSKDVKFYVSDVVSSSDGSMVVKVFVQYPGGEMSGLESGSKEFGDENLSFDGNDAAGGAKIFDYDYIYSSGSLKFNVQVSSESDVVIPSFESELKDGVLSVVFPSLASDSVYSWGSTIELPMGVVLEISRGGSESTYTFSGIKSYRVFGEGNPNQVVIDMTQ
ncbi:hypothetical protein K8R20_02765 [bacterium]|nr:hypothetical protein [bacterium]